MRLSDVISHLDLTVYPIVGLVIFLIVFAAVSVRALRTRKADCARYASLPLDGGEPTDRITNGEQRHV
ncbi:MAG: cbb3-type cytochrome c oxidase subunit 3 [Phycisphaeraceae bacterium]|nr:MAG: cbb3-type cytochrome c oxidase subunit 3 [Phycisphaeraceae bacterium]